MTSYDELHTPANLRRAYLWIQSNPDAAYKNHFRAAYSAYATASARGLDRLRTHLLRRDYQPGHAGKVFLPKPSGVLRPITLLSVNDQIVYQACANVIADKLYPRIRARHGVNVFGHVYAGRTSMFFFRRWQPQYRAFCKTVAGHIRQGHSWVADFDLAAFYDSIDHHVLRQFLTSLGLDEEFNNFFFECLRTWTSTTWPTNSKAIYMEHGIPQGPQASGLIAEVMLQYIDRAGTRGKSVKYARYVDDIKLFASTEHKLRQKLVGLDLACKEIGLFPQSSKIDIHQTTRPETEVKSVSMPPERIADAPTASPARRARIRELLREKSLRSRSATVLKFLLKDTTPHHTLNSKLIDLVEAQPEFAPNVARYFAQYRKLPPKAAKRISCMVSQEWIYHAPQATLLMGVLDNMPDPYKSDCLRYCHDRITGKRRAFLRAQPTLQGVMAVWCVRHGRLTFNELQAFFWSQGDWWVRQYVVWWIEEGHFGMASLEVFLRSVVCDEHADVARAGAARLLEQGAREGLAKLKVHESARIAFAEAGYLKSIGRPPSLVDKALAVVSRGERTGISWAAILGQHHREAERYALNARRYFESNYIDAYIVQLDSLLDMVFERLFYVCYPGAQYPNYGAALANPVMWRALPDVCQAFKAVHDLRIRSPMAHPKDRRRGRINKPLRHRDVRHLGPRLRDATGELEAQGY